jgi:hypothetical protein
MKIKGVFGRCNEKNNNGRIYPTNVLEGQLQKVQPLISERRLCGELDHPQNDTVKLSNASHLITKLEMKGDELIGEAEILKTPAGLTAKALVEGGVKIGISSRGMGTLSEDAKGNKIVNEDFRLVTFDLVADPSTRGAFPGLSESTQSQFARESQSKLEKESNFVTMLQAKLREAYDPWIEEAKKKKDNGPTDDGDGMDPVGQGDADIDNDGDSDESDAYLRKRRAAIGKAMGKKGKAMKAVKEEGSWHQIGYALAEAFADEIEKTTVAKADAEGDTKGPSFMDRRRVAAGKKSAAKADVKAAAIRQKGQIKLARKMDKAKAAAAEGKPVTGGEKAADLAGKAVNLAKKAPGAIKGAAEKTTQAAEKFGERLGKAKVRGMQQQQAKRNIAARGKADRDARLAAASAKKPEPQAKKPGISDEEKYQRKALGQAAQKKATADVAARAKKGAGGQFGAGVGRSDKADMQKAIARRERKTGKKVNLTKQQALDLSHRVYSRMGYSLAEAFGLIEGADAPMKGSRQEGQTEVRKASYNVQAQRKMNKAAKERDKAKENR